ncbi:MAG: outer membrane protein transport protein [Deltaproteobacteria bacterium]|nr:outer membrane protein transport protein [Deltaproteobacteria bacterium]
MARGSAIVAVAATLVLPSPPAVAGGFEFPDNGVVAVGRGGAFAAKADDLTAIYFNPAGLAGQKGTRLLFNTNFPRQSVTFTRSPDEGGTAFGPVSNSGGFFTGDAKIGAPIAAIASDFGLKDVTFALGLYGPSAYGASKYPKNGPQKYALIDMDLAMVFYNLSMGWRAHRSLDLGVSLQLAHNMKTNISQGVNSWFAAGSGPSAGYDTIVHLKFDQAFSVGMLFGALYRPPVKGLHIGLTVRPFPIHFEQGGTVTPEYPGSFLARQAEAGRVYITSGNVYMTQDLPIMGRLGVRYAFEHGGRELFDIEADVVFEAWSVVDAFDIRFGGEMGIGQDVGPDYKQPMAPVSVPKDWKDTVSVRVGGDYNVLKATDLKPGLAVRLGGFYESPAVPEETTNLDFLSFHRFGVGTGFTLSWYAFDLSFAYSHIFQLSRDVTDSSIVVQMPMSPCQPPYTDAKCATPGTPPGTVVGAGRYESGIDVLSVGLNVWFDRFFRKEEPKVVD